MKKQYPFLRAGMRLALAAPIALAGAAAWPQGRPPWPPVATPAKPSPTTASLQNLDCMIQPSLTVQVGAPSAGVIERIDVDRGDFVRRGQLLVQLSAKVERAALSVARERAEQVGEVQSATSATALANNDFQRASALLGEQFVSKAYVERAKAEAQVAGGRTVQAEERQRLASREVELAQAQLAQRQVHATVDGVVVDRYMSAGEFVEQKPVLRLAVVDPLRVDVLVPAAAFGRVRIGDVGGVTPELIDKRRLSAVVKTVDRVIDAASNTFRVRLELPNPEHRLPAGLRCTVSLGEGAAPGEAGAPAPAAAAALSSVTLAPPSAAARRRDGS